MAYLVQKNIGFIGTGNMAQAIMRTWVDSKVIKPDQIFACNRTPGKLKKVVDQFGIRGVQNAEELIESCEVIILAMKPQDLHLAIESISSSFQSHQIVISLAAGISLSQLKKLLPDVGSLARVMPNTASQIGQSVVGYCTNQREKDVDSLIEELLSPLGLVVRAEEGEEFEALTVACSSGIGFVLELMLYWQEWLEEHGFEAKIAKAMTVKTFLGASQLAEHSKDISLEELQAKVVSKKGVTGAGLDSMRELELERALRYSFEKAVLRDRELGKQS